MRTLLFAVFQIFKVLFHRPDGPIKIWSGNTLPRQLPSLSQKAPGLALESKYFVYPKSSASPHSLIQGGVFFWPRASKSKRLSFLRSYAELAVPYLFARRRNPGHKTLIIKSTLGPPGTRWWRISMSVWL